MDESSAPNARPRQSCSCSCWVRNRPHPVGSDTEISALSTVRRHVPAGHPSTETQDGGPIVTILPNGDSHPTRLHSKINTPTTDSPCRATSVGGRNRNSSLHRGVGRTQFSSPAPNRWIPDRTPRATRLTPETAFRASPREPRQPFKPHWREPLQGRLTVKRSVRTLIPD